MSGMPFIDFNVKEGNMEDFYEVVVCCDNCGAVLTVEVDRGVFRETIMKDMECANCGCEMEEAEWLDVLFPEGGEE